MKRFFGVVTVILIPVICMAQYKSQAKLPSISQAIAKPANNLLLGFLNPDKLTMHHNFSMSFMTMGQHNMMVNAYLNTINYKISDPLSLRLNLGLMNTPYSSFNQSAINNTNFFGGAELFYRPSDNTFIKVGFDVRPNYYYPGSYYNRYPYYIDSDINREDLYNGNNIFER
jgi:hypothetical protein